MATPTINLKIMLLNAENLFLLSDQKLTKEHLSFDEQKWQKLSTSVYENKPLQKLRNLTSVVADVDPDIILLAEVGGTESLNQFNHLFLEDKYSVAITEGNSARHIDIGFLIRKNLGFYFDHLSNKNRLIDFLYPHERGIENKTSHRFSRDVAELHLFTKDRDKPFLILLLTHLKSRLDPEGIDPNGFERRQAELLCLLQIYQELEEKFKEKIPIVVSGDFNGNASLRNTDHEFKPIYEKTKLLDVCQIAQLREEECVTFYQVTRNSRPDGRQIDYCFLSPMTSQFLDPKSVSVYRYKNHLGLPADPPTSLDAKFQLPSDHYPLVFCLKNVPMI